MPLHYKNLIERILSAIFAIPIVIAALYWSIWGYFVLFLVVAVLALLEFYRLTALGGASPNRLVGTVAGIAIYVLVFMYTLGQISGRYLHLLCPIVALVYPIELYRKKEFPFTNIAYTLLGIVYVMGPFTLLHSMAAVQGSYNKIGVIGILLILWAHDTGAYLVGASVGKHKLFQRISPHKSWEGTLGGASLALIVGYIMSHYGGSGVSISLTTWLGMVCIVVVAGTYGDLVASMLKRSLKVKDSGEAIPGHGGFLDRFDSFLLAIPFIVAWIELFH